ncbi:putative choline transporter, neither null mutation nor overexpression affects choline transport [Oleoguttula mirabilis]|uniref:Protein PNS1 n=1 Tax=Oleoguttula mirabilis TaxID=1507867 RepID=A0AAV9JGP6_9PEZI|nr:putative choline transporter, neither null mutation nor overexpression affects choline transport [Oleoguttula mirabilis]
MAQQRGGESAGYYNGGDEEESNGEQKGYPMPAYGGQQQHGGQQQYNGGQQQSYAPPQHMPPPPTYQQDYGKWDQNSKPTFDQAFKLEKPKWNDLWAGVLLIAVFAGFVAVSAISISGYASTKSFNDGGIYNSSNDFGLSTNTIVLFAFCLVMALVLGYGYVWMARMFTKQFIWVTGILHVIFGFVTAIYMLVQKYYSGGIVFLLFACFAAYCFYTWIPRIPFSVLMLQTAIDVSKNFGHVYLVSFLGGLIAAAFGAWFSVTLVAVYVKYEPGANPACSTSSSCSSAKVIGLLVFITFAGYWISEWLKNTIHTTISGVYGAWYFSPKNPPKGATRGAARRALTYSFGSISFGSLIVALINLLRQACSIAQQSEANSGNIAASCAFCILGCIIGLLDWAVQFINRYAFSYMALYGKSYIESAKATWKLIKDRGIDALVNECLIGPVLTMGATFVAYACALLAYLYLIFTKPSYNTSGEFTPVVVAYAFLIGLQITNCFTTPLSSGIDTIFVAAAWDPDVLMREHPDLYARMVTVYPHVQQAIHA